MSKEIVSAKIDVVFKELFIRKKSLLKNFLSDTLNIPLENILNVTLTNPEMPADHADGKLSRLDLSMRLKEANNTESLINVEMQVNSQSYFKKRTMLYWSKLYGSEIESGQSYDNLKRTICINVIDFNITHKQDYHTEVVAKDNDTNEQFTDLMSIHFFELKKVKDALDVNDKRSLWMHLIKADTEEELYMLKNTNVPVIEQAVQVIFDMSADTALRERARIREKALWDEVSNMEYARKEGRAEGVDSVIEKMRKSGMSEEQIKNILNC